jgi:hypothetical protein
MVTATEPSMLSVAVGLGTLTVTVRSHSRVYFWPKLNTGAVWSSRMMAKMTWSALLPAASAASYFTMYSERRL